MACRIIDCFLLDGEVFIFKTAIALLIYYESLLLKSSHYQIKDKLKNFDDVEVERLFSIIMDEVQLEEDKFSKELAK